MAGFVGYYDALKAEEDAAAAERKKRDDEMREAGRIEEREKQMALMASKLAESEAKNTVNKVMSLDMINRHPLFQDNKIIAETIDQEFMMASNVMKEIRQLRYALRHRLENAEGYQDQFDGLDIFDGRKQFNNPMHLSLPISTMPNNMNNQHAVSTSMLQPPATTTNNNNNNNNINDNINSSASANASKLPTTGGISMLASSSSSSHLSIPPNRQAAQGAYLMTAGLGIGNQIGAGDNNATSVG